jgi:hypothetical protein
MVEQTANITANTVKVVGEIFVPGSSQLIQGNVGSGVAHFVIGGVLVATLAPVAPVLAALVGLGVRVNSFSSSITGKNVWNEVHLSVDGQDPKKPNTPTRTSPQSA